VAAVFQACGNTPVPEPTQQPKPAPVVTINFDGVKAYELLKAQTDMGTRHPGSPGHKKCLEWIQSQAKLYSDKVTTQGFSHKWSKNGRTYEMTNVIATMSFGKPKTALLIAHWDTRPTADQEYDPQKAAQPIPGANDGASGVAVLLELMRAFKQTPPEVNVVFLFVDGEDLGPGLDEMFLGAKHFAKNLPKQKLDYGILLDMVGDKDLRIPKEPNSSIYAGDLLTRFYKTAQLHGYEKTFPNEFQGAIYDDHLPINDAGIPTIDLIDFDYPHWHTLQDTADKCSPASLTKVGSVVEIFLRTEGAK
jgi:glutaminyl-peptide cyclotransferase